MFDHFLWTPCSIENAEVRIISTVKLALIELPTQNPRLQAPPAFSTQHHLCFVKPLLSTTIPWETSQDTEWAITFKTAAGAENAWTWRKDICHPNISKTPQSFFCFFPIKNQLQKAFPLFALKAFLLCSQSFLIHSTFQCQRRHCMVIKYWQGP